MHELKNFVKKHIPQPTALELRIHDDNDDEEDDDDDDDDDDGDYFYDVNDDMTIIANYGNEMIMKTLKQIPAQDSTCSSEDCTSCSSFYWNNMQRSGVYIRPEPGTKTKMWIEPRDTEGFLLSHTISIYK